MKFVRLLTGSIRNKLLAGVTFLLVGGLGFIVWISYNRYTDNNRKFAFKAMGDVAERLASQFQREVQNIVDRARPWSVQALRGQAQLDSLVEGDSAIWGVQVWDAASASVARSGFQKAHAGDPAYKAAPSADDMKSARSGQLVYGLVPGAKAATHRLLLPAMKQGDRVTHVAAVYVNAALLAPSFKGDGVTQLVLFNEKSGAVIFGSGVEAQGIVQQGLVPPELAKRSADSKQGNAVLSLRGFDKDIYLAAFNKQSGVPGMSVGALISEQQVMAAANQVVKRSAYIGLMVLGVALALAGLFAESLSRPLLGLVDAAHSIAQGQFDVRVQRSTHDEVGTLSETFNEMAKGLAEREKIKEVFGKFHSKAVFAKLMQEDKIKLGGERLPVTVFFSDIRSFTSTSEEMKPEQVVEMLNEYMSEMVAIVEKYDGVVDKFVGDAIMAVWGLPTPNPAQDAEKALRACLEMRETLVLLNERRKARGQFELKIGMGLNSGEVIAGNIGSASRMEYTVIGDTVNTASRMESLTKEFETDLLVNETTKKLVPATVFEFGESMQAKAKGKADAVNVFKVRGWGQGARKAA